MSPNPSSTMHNHNRPIYFLLVLILIIVSACLFLLVKKRPDHCHHDRISGNGHCNDSSISYYAVPKNEAIKSIKYYQKIAKEKFQGTIPIRGFTIRTADLLEVSGMPVPDTVYTRYAYVRMYLGLDSASNLFKIFLTPVDSANLNVTPPIAGKDVILNGPYSRSVKVKVKGDVDDGDYVLDLSAPCPNSCDDESPFYMADQ
jgi:hypothetical protein